MDERENSTIQPENFPEDATVVVRPPVTAPAQATPTDEATQDYIPAPVFAQVVTQDVASRPGVFGNENAPATQNSLAQDAPPVAPAAPAADVPVAPVPAPEPPKKQKRGCGIAVILVVLLLVGGIAAGIVLAVPYLRYQTATNALNYGNYDEAYELFLDLGDYKNSQIMAQESRYQQALMEQSNGNFEEAIRLLESLNGYRDSATQIKETKYLRAKSYLENDEYTNAQRSFSELGDYKDSADMLCECSYQQALDYFEDDLHAKAIELLESISSYSDSADQINAIKYDYILSNYNNENYTTYDYLTDLKKVSYEDCVARYADLYTWRVTFTAVNSSKTDSTTNYTSISKYDPVIFHYKVWGGTPDAYTDLEITGYHINNNRIEHTISDVYDGYSSHFGWYSGVWASPEYGSGGTITLYIYDGDGNYLTSKSITINNY